MGKKELENLSRLSTKGTIAQDFGHLICHESTPEFFKFDL
jgi:hypothetical protein